MRSSPVGCAHRVGPNLGQESKKSLDEEGRQGKQSLARSELTVGTIVLAILKPSCSLMAFMIIPAALLRVSTQTHGRVN